MLGLLIEKPDQLRRAHRLKEGAHSGVFEFLVGLAADDAEVPGIFKRQP
jgi:hypothetical protein